MAYLISTATRAYLISAATAEMRKALVDADVR
jgi:hypothetical protein